MKKRKHIIISLVMILLLVVLFVPIPTSPLRDGGTKIFNALTYKIVKWRRLISTDMDDGSRYENTSVYWFPDNMKNIEELWALETNQ